MENCKKKLKWFFSLWCFYHFSLSNCQASWWATELKFWFKRPFDTTWRPSYLKFWLKKILWSNHAKVCFHHIFIATFIHVLRLPTFRNWVWAQKFLSNQKFFFLKNVAITIVGGFSDRLKLKMKFLVYLPLVFPRGMQFFS